MAEVSEPSSSTVMEELCVWAVWALTGWSLISGSSAFMLRALLSEMLPISTSTTLLYTHWYSYMRQDLVQSGYVWRWSNLLWIFSTSESEIIYSQPHEVSDPRSTPWLVTNMLCHSTHCHELDTLWCLGYSTSSYLSKQTGTWKLYITVFGLEVFPLGQSMTVFTRGLQTPQPRCLFL